MRQKGFGFAIGANAPVFSQSQEISVNANSIRNVLIVPNRPDEDFAGVIAELERHRIRARVVTEEEPVLDAADRILIVIPNDNGNRAQEVQKLALRASVQVSHAYASDIVRVLRQHFKV